MQKRAEIETTEKMAVDLKGLQAMLSLGRTSAEKVGDAAGATFKVGKRKLYKVDKINAYLDKLASKKE